MNVKTLLGAGLLAAATLLQAASAQAASEYLVSTDWLEKNLSDPKVRIVEVSVIPGVYERGHIPGAVNFAWHSDLVDPMRRDIATRQAFQELLRKSGISNDSTTILYGDNNNWFAAWGAWVFDVYGVDNVKLLDGGRAKWEAEGRALDNRSSTPVAGNVTVKAANQDLRAFLPDVLAAAEKRSDVQLVDIRSGDEYSGKIFAPQGVQELAIRAGHIPGAVNVPWARR